MDLMTIHTDFAPAARASEDEVQRQRQMFQDAPLMTHMLNAVPDIVMVLNRERQIVYANRSLYDTLGIAIEDIDDVLGNRPGEVLKCVHAFESEGGCGTTEFCSTCGAVKAILASQENRADVQECRIIQDQTGDALDLRVWAKPLVLGGEAFTVFTVANISHEKRREALERIFFHDILNTAGGLKGLAELIREASLEELNEFQEIILRLSDDLIEEIQAQRQLAAAENDALATHPSIFDTEEVLMEVVDLYAGHEVARGRKIQIAQDAYRGSLTTDRVLLRRVLGNMTKNALEAAKPGDMVTLGCEAVDEEVAFWVHNPGFIPPDIQLQIFQRSFSTKGAGRGLGTYSIKLLTGRYLKGRVSFGTSPASGTTFRAICPHLPMEAQSVPASMASAIKKGRDKLRILIAEDNLVNQKLMSRLIERLGHSTVVVDTGKAAVTALARESFDLVLMDCQMPEMDGFEATRAIRTSDLMDNSDVPIVAITGHTDEENREACLAAGMNDHLPKPVGKEALAAILNKWV